MENSDENSDEPGFHKLGNLTFSRPLWPLLTLTRRGMSAIYFMSLLHKIFGLEIPNKVEFKAQISFPKSQGILGNHFTFQNQFLDNSKTKF